MQLTKDEILEFYSVSQFPPSPPRPSLHLSLLILQEFMSHEAPCRRKLSVHVTPTAPRRNSEASKPKAVQSEKSKKTVNGFQKREEEGVDFSLPEVIEALPHDSPVTHGYTQAVEITDISEFKSKLHLFPTIKPYISISLQEIVP